MLATTYIFWDGSVIRVPPPHLFSDLGGDRWSPLRTLGSLSGRSAGGCGFGTGGKTRLAAREGRYQGLGRSAHRLNPRERRCEEEIAWLIASYDP